MYDVHDSMTYMILSFGVMLIRKKAYLEVILGGINLALCTDGVNPFSHHRVFNVANNANSSNSSEFTQTC